MATCCFTNFTHNDLLSNAISNFWSSKVYALLVGDTVIVSFYPVANVVSYIIYLSKGTFRLPLRQMASMDVKHSCV